MKKIILKIIISVPLVFLVIFAIFGVFFNSSNANLDEIVFLIGCILFGIWALIMILFSEEVKKIKISRNSEIFQYRRAYGYINNKKIDFNNVEIFRELPFDGNIYRMLTIPYLNNLEFDYANILIAVFLKMVNENQIRITADGKIDLIEVSKYTHKAEREIYSSIKGIYPSGFSFSLEDFASWCKKNSYLSGIFVDIIDEEIYKLKKEGHIYKRKTKEECQKNYVMDDYIYEETKKYFGLKKFLKEFSLINERSIIEVKLWEQYLMISALFGMAEEVGEGLEKLYPEEIKNSKYKSIENLNETLEFINLLKEKDVNNKTSNNLEKKV